MNGGAGQPPPADGAARMQADRDEPTQADGAARMLADRDEPTERDAAKASAKRPRRRRSGGEGPLLLAHRGDWRHGPEDSLEAFRAALALPTCDGLEFDVRQSRDGVPVIIHDETLARVHGRDDAVVALPADELVGLGVTTLEAVLAEAGRDAFLDVELKEDVGEPAIAALVASRGTGLENAVISSFEVAALRTIRRLRPSWPCWLNAIVLTPDTLTLAEGLGCTGVSCEWHGIDRAGVDAATDLGLEVAAWTVRRRNTVARLVKLGVAAVCVEGRPLDGLV